MQGLVLLLCWLHLVSSYNVGVGRADVTGPAAEIGMMGYAKQGQNTGGESEVITVALHNVYHIQGSI